MKDINFVILLSNKRFARLFITILCYCCYFGIRQRTLILDVPYQYVSSYKYKKNKYYYLDALRYLSKVKVLNIGMISKNISNFKKLRIPDVNDVIKTVNISVVLSDLYLPVYVWMKDIKSFMTLFSNCNI